jgi:hypothetical protein
MTKNPAHLRYPLGCDISNPALTKRDCLTVASMARFGGIADFLSLPFVRFRVQRPAARFFTLQALMPESHEITNSQA